MQFNISEINASYRDINEISSKFNFQRFSCLKYGGCQQNRKEMQFGMVMVENRKKFQQKCINFIYHIESNERQCLRHSLNFDIPELASGKRGARYRAATDENYTHSVKTRKQLLQTFSSDILNIS